MNHLSSLLSVRTRTLSRRVAEAGPLAWVFICITLIGLAAVGYALTPTLSTGKTALSTSFWLCCAACSITSFHAMDLMFRVQNVRAVDHLPVDLGSLFWDRLLSLLADAWLYAVPISVVFAPMIVGSHPTTGSTAAGIALVGLPTAGLASMAAYLYLGVRVSGGQLVEDQSDERDGIDADLYGGPGGMLLYAPGLALAAALVALLASRLALKETFAPDAPADVVSVMWGIGLLAALGLVVYAHRAFTRDFIPIRARFREADAMSFDVDLDYQESVFESPVWGEQWAPPVARPLVRAYALQYQRRHLLVRYGFPAAGVASAAAMLRVGPDTFPLWAVAIVPTVLLGSFGNPWRRIADEEFQPNVLDALPMDLSERRDAAVIQTLRETAFAVGTFSLFAVPSVAIAAGLYLAGSVLLATVGAAGLLAVGSILAHRLSDSTTSVAPPLAAAAATGIAFLSLPTAAALGILTAIWMIISRFRHPASSDARH